MLKNKKWSYFLLAISLVTICSVTIYPFNFVTPQQFSWKNIADQFHNLTNVKDYVRNILLFTSFGIAYASIIDNKKYNLVPILVFSFLISAALSSSIELIQILLPSRTSSWSDVACNSLGGLLGSSLYCFRQEFVQLANGVVKGDYQQVSCKFLATIIASYCITITCAIFLLSNNINLKTWNDDAYLSIASEVTNQIFWRGYVTSLYICDRAIDSSEIATAFGQTHSFFSKSPSLITSLVFLDYQASYADQKQQIPNLLWQKELPFDKLNSLDKAASNSEIDYQIHHSKAVLFNNKNSLISTSAAIKLNQAIKSSYEFSLSTIIASDKLKQVGPSRIISLGENIYSRNIMLGQEGSNLIFRLRTPATGENATQPGFYIPNFFKDKDLHQILITFAKKKLTFYIDRPENQYVFAFQPSTLSRLFLPWTTQQWNVNLQSHSLLRSQIIFYSLILFPLIMLSIIFILSLIQQLTKA